MWIKVSGILCDERITIELIGTFYKPAVKPDIRIEMLDSQQDDKIQDEYRRYKNIKVHKWINSDQK